MLEALVFSVIFYLVKLILRYFSFSAMYYSISQK